MQSRELKNTVTNCLLLPLWQKPDNSDICIKKMCKFLQQLNGSVKEPNKFHNYETKKIIHKASDAAKYIKLFGSSTRDRHARCINVIL